MRRARSGWRGNGGSLPAARTALKSRGAGLLAARASRAPRGPSPGSRIPVEGTSPSGRRPSRSRPRIKARACPGNVGSPSPPGPARACRRPRLSGTPPRSTALLPDLRSALRSCVGSAPDGTGGELPSAGRLRATLGIHPPIGKGPLTVDSGTRRARGALEGSAGSAHAERAGGAAPCGMSGGGPRRRQVNEDSYR